MFLSDNPIVSSDNPTDFRLGNPASRKGKRGKQVYTSGILIRFGKNPFFF